MYLCVYIYIYGKLFIYLDINDSFLRDIGNLGGSMSIYSDLWSLGIGIGFWIDSASLDLLFLRVPTLSFHLMISMISHPCPNVNDF